MTRSAVLTISATYPALPEHPLTPWTQLLAHRPSSHLATEERHGAVQSGAGLPRTQQGPALPLSSASLGGDGQEGERPAGGNLQSITGNLNVHAHTHPAQTPPACPLQRLLFTCHLGQRNPQGMWGFALPGPQPSMLRRQFQQVLTSSCRSQLEALLKERF